MATQMKKDIVASLSDSIKNNSAIYLVDYLGISANDDNAMRRDFRKSGLTYVVAKNTLLKIALKENGIDSMDSYLEKGTAVAMADDLVTVVKKVDEYSKKYKGIPKGKAVYFEGTVYTGDELLKLATLPSKEELYGMLASVLIGPVRNLAFGIKAIAEKEEETE